MGRTNPTYRDTLRDFEERWQPFRRALRAQYQTDFDRLLEGADRFADAAGYQNPRTAERAILVSMLLAHEVELRRLRERVAGGEQGTAGGEQGADGHVADEQATDARGDGV